MATNTTRNEAMSRDELETNIARVLRWVMIAFFFFVTVFPFYWMVNLSFRPEQDIQTNPTKLFPSWDNIETTLHPVGCWIRYGRDEPYTQDEMSRMLLERNATPALMNEFGLSLLVIEPETLATVYTLVAEDDLTDVQRRNVLANAENVPEGFVLVEDIPEQPETEYLAIPSDEGTAEQEPFVTQPTSSE